MYIRYVRSSLAVVLYVVVLIVKSQSKRLLSADLVAEDMKENIRATAE